MVGSAKLTPVLHQHPIWCFFSKKKGRSLHSLEGELEVVVQVVQVDEEVPEPPPNALKHQSIPKIRGKADKVDSHPLVKLLVLHLKQFHRRLPHLEDLSFGKDICHSKIILDEIILMTFIISWTGKISYNLSRKQKSPLLNPFFPESASISLVHSSS